MNEFEGPLDLMLYLISKHKLNICDIEILSLVEQFTDYINAMEERNMDIAGEFVEMAARLVHMKTVFLLPRHDEEKEQLRAQLTGELMEYQACKQAAQKLREQNLIGSIFIPKGEDIPVDKIFKGNHNALELWECYMMAVGKGKRKLPPPASTFNTIVSKRIVSVSSRIIFVLKMLYRNTKIDFMALFEESEERSEMVATFLAVLELIKAKRITITDNQSHVVFSGRTKEEENAL